MSQDRNLNIAIDLVEEALACLLEAQYSNDSLDSLGLAIETVENLQCELEELKIELNEDEEN